MRGVLARIWTGIFILSMAAACGGGGTPGLDDGGVAGDPGGGVPGGGTPPDPPPSPLNIVTAAERTAYYSTLLPTFSAVNMAATSGDVTPLGATVAMGSVTYEGYMQLIMGNASVSANVIGDAALQVSFDGGPVIGAADGFLGVTPDEAMVRQVVRYDGVINISGGQVTAGADSSADINFQVDGTLNNGVNTFAVDGTLEGGFFGDEAEGLYAIGSYTGVHGSMDTTIDGVAGLGNIGIGTVSAVKP